MKIGNTYHIAYGETTKDAQLVPLGISPHGEDKVMWRQFDDMLMAVCFIRNYLDEASKG